MWDWMKDKLESRLQGEVSISICRWHHPYGRKWRTKEPLDESEREWKIWLKIQHSKNEDHGIWSLHFMARDGETMETVTDFIFLGSKITADGDCSHEIKRCLLLGRKAMTNLSSVQLLSHVWLFATPWTAACQASLSITNFWSLLRLMSIELVMPSNHLILCCRLPPAFNLSQHQGLFNESILRIRWPKYWSFSFSISPSNEYSGLISFRLYWFDLLAVQGTLKSLLQHHTFKSINSSVLSFVYSPTLTSIHDYWKHHSFD